MDQLTRREEKTQLIVNTVAVDLTESHAHYIKYMFCVGLSKLNERVVLVSNSTVPAANVHKVIYIPYPKQIYNDLNCQKVY